MLWMLWACSPALLASKASGFILSTVPASCVDCAAGAQSRTCSLGSRGSVHDKWALDSTPWRCVTSISRAVTPATTLKLSATPTPTEGDDDFEVNFGGLDGPQRVQPQYTNSDDRSDAGAAAAAPPASRDSIGDLDALDDLLGLHKTGSTGAGDNDGMDALDDLLRRDAAVGGLSDASSSLNEDRARGDDGFGALDDLLGLDDGARYLPSASAASEPAVVSPFEAMGAASGDGAVGPVETESDRDFIGTNVLDDLLQSPVQDQTPTPPAAATSPAKVSSTVVPGSKSPSSASTGAADSDWLDELLQMEDNSVKPKASDALSSSGAIGGGIESGSSGFGAPSTSWADDSSDLDDLPSLVPQAEKRSVEKEEGSLPQARPESPESLDDWLADLLKEDEVSTPTPRSVSNAGGKYDRFPDEGPESKTFNDWKSQTAPVRSNVMGRGNRGQQQDFDTFSGPDRNRDSAFRTGQERATRGQWGERRQPFGDSRHGGGWEDRQRGGGEQYRGRDDRFGRMDDQNRGRLVMPEQSAVTADIKILGSRGRWEDALRALVAARVRGVPMHIFMYNSAISAVAKSGRWKEALSMMDQMKEEGLEFDRFTYSGAIKACGNGGQWSKAVDLLDQMLADGAEPDQVCISCAITACTNGGQPDRALTVLERGINAGVIPIQSDYNALILAFGDSGQWEKSLELLSQMRISGLRPSPISYQLAMKACGVGGKWERAVLLLQEMEDDGLSAELHSYLAVLEALRDAGQWEKALALIGEMDEVGIEPDEACYAFALEACGEHGRWWESIEAIKAMRDANLQPDLETYNYVLRACMNGKAWTQASFIMDQIRLTGRRPNQETWDLIFDTCFVCDRWDAAVRYISDMFAEEVWFDTTKIREEFEENCPYEEYRKQALTMIQMDDEMDAAKKKRMTRRNKTMAAKARAKNILPAPRKIAPRKPRQPRLQTPKPEYDAIEY